MPTLSLLFPLLFIVGGLAGGLGTLRLLAGRRRPGQFPDVLHQWSEKPLPSWKYEPYSSAAILVHTLSMIALGLAAMVATFRPATFDAAAASDRPALAFLLSLAEGTSITLVGYLLGTLVAFPLSRLRKTAVDFAVTKEGIAHGRTQMPWSWFSHFSIDDTNGLLSFHSAFAADLPSLISKPTAPESLEELATTIRGYLPARRPSAPRTWYRTKRLLVPAMFLLCTACVAAGWLGTGLPRELALIVVALGATLLLLLGGRLITLFGFGILRIPPEPAGGGARPAA